MTHYLFFVGTLTSSFAMHVYQYYFYNFFKLGLPTREGMDKPMFNYERILYDSLLIPENSNPLKHHFKHKHFWVKQATGLGITEFFLSLTI
jgi:hypothetical protein